VKLYSTNNKNRIYSLKEAVLQGIAPDGGLFMPTKIEKLPDDFYLSLSSLPFHDICIEVVYKLLGDSIPLVHLHQIIDKAITFPVPLIDLSPQIKVAELWHGPSLAFKDFGAQFMAQMMAYFNRGSNTPLNILVATSGDTGGAVAAGFHLVPGINVIILYPKGKVSYLQEKQLTTFGDNVTALEIDGTFDDCQSLVKHAFTDPILTKKIRFSSANSINIARLIPQSFYYFEAVKSLINKDSEVVVSVPSGNFGNLSAGIIARKMGLPINKFIASTNINDIVPRYLRTKIFQPRTSVETLSNAMDVGNPSNFTRMLDLYSSTWNKMTQDIIGYSYNDKSTIQAIQNIHRHYNYICDPHGAIGFLGLNDFLNDYDNKNTIGVFLETAHPSKFKSTIDQALKLEIPVHGNLEKLKARKSEKISLSNNYSDLVQFLLDTCSK